MKKVSITLLLVMLAVTFVSGCARSTPETSLERNFRITQSWKLDNRMFVDDWDDFWMIDKNSQLSPFHQRLGY